MSFLAMGRLKLVADIRRRRKRLDSDSKSAAMRSSAVFLLSSMAS